MEIDGGGKDEGGGEGEEKEMRVETRQSLGAL